MACVSTTYSFHVSDHPLCVDFDCLYQVPTSKLFSVVFKVRSACSHLCFQPFLFLPHYRALDLPTFEDDEINSKECRFGIRITFNSYGFHSGDEVPPSYKIFAVHELAFTPGAEYTIVKPFRYPTYLFTCNTSTFLSFVSSTVSSAVQYFPNRADHHFHRKKSTKQ